MEVQVVELIILVLGEFRGEISNNDELESILETLKGSQRFLVYLWKN